MAVERSVDIQYGYISTMPFSLPGSRKLYLIVIVLIIVLAALFFVRIVPSDPRPTGSVTDIEDLANRSDVNVLFILIDTLRADRLGAWNYSRDTSPSLDMAAARGVRFARQLAQSSWTKCSMASLWTGLYPSRTRVTRFDDVLPDAARLPAEIFADEGFVTGGVWRNGWVAENFGFSQGFELYLRPSPVPLTPGEKRENPSVIHAGSDRDIIDSFGEFLNVHQQKRWFFYAHMMDIHEYVYDEASSLFGTGYSDIYDNSIRRLDGLIGHIFGILHQRGQFEKTLVVIASDHGEAFRERGYEGHARTVYPEVTEVPFILSFPFNLEPGIVVRERTENVDIWPTVLELLGLPPLEDPDGRSRVPEILAAARGERNPPGSDLAFAHLDQNWGKRGIDAAPTIAVASGDFRFVSSLSRDEPSAAPTEELFTRVRDPLEIQDIITDHPDLALELRDATSDYLASPPPPWGDSAEHVELDEMELNQLRALGYSLP
jgi:arylsulfatase A-like enzyme